MFESFTPTSAFAGGVLIGGAATLLMWLNGRVAGVSGIVAGTLEPRAGDLRWRLLFIAGLILGAALYGAGGGDLTAVRVTVDWPLVVAGGLLVGFGTRLSGGCTSGHGVCGVALISRRSLVATGIFMATGVATVFVLRHLIGA